MCFRGFVRITLTSVGYYSQYLSNVVSFFYLITDLENCRDLSLSDRVSGSYSASSIEFCESSCGPNAGIILLIIDLVPLHLSRGTITYL